MDSIAEFRAKPIGIVEEGISREKTERLHKSRYQVTSRVRVFEQYADGLAGLCDYSHIILVWAMHEKNKVRLRVIPWGRTDMPEVGIFSTRFPPRPNPIGVSVVELLTVASNLLSVKGLDAWTGTPILDIKPYDYYDIVKAPKVPDWSKKYWDEHYAKKRYMEVGSQQLNVD
jgi:tRNA-Thr(GGU) m(6)t(6)A37 methyltransferase TsaA